MTSTRDYIAEAGVPPPKPERGPRKLKVVEPPPDHDWQPPVEIPPSADAEPIQEGAAEPAAPAVLRSLDAADFAGRDIKPTRWLVRNRIPMGKHSLFSGDGAAGKTTMKLQLLHTVVSRRTDWLGAVVEENGSAVFLTGEEEEEEAQRRLALINEATGTTFDDLSGLHLFCFPGDDIVLGATNRRTGRVEATDFYRAFERRITDIRPKLIAIEAAADVFAGNENERGEVRQFGQLVRRLAIKADAAVLLSQHPSVSGMAANDGRSGSTHWRNSFRAQMHLSSPKARGEDAEEGASDLRILRIGKSNYGPAGETITLRWRQGLFVPEGAAPSLDRMAAEADVDALFLRLLQITIAQGRPVGPSASVTYAPTVFAKMPEAAGAKKNALAAAMERLFSAGKIRVREEGSGSHKRSRLVPVE